MTINRQTLSVLALVAVMGVVIAVAWLGYQTPAMQLALGFIAYCF